ncbi:MAG: NADH-quinone oxidoreductase subunit M [Planctomycetota bacterium]|nr:NADH-quinone oxidoreductase subunit M [Planctomycetota bacterium]
MYELMDWPLLSLYTFAPALGALVLLLVPSRRADIVKTIAAAAAAVPALLGVYVFFAYKDTGNITYYESFRWIEGLNVYYRLGIDGLSAPMIVLSGVVGFIAVVASWGIEKQVKGYFALILLLLTGMNGVFVALDFFLFYVFWELMLLPMYFLIGVWGGPKRVYAAIKFFLYTMAGSVLMLVVLLATWYWSDARYLEGGVAANRIEEARLVGLLSEKRRAQEGAADAEARKALDSEILALNAQRGKVRSDRARALMTVNDLREEIVERRVTALYDLRRFESIERVAGADKRALLARHGIDWAGDPALLLEEAERVRQKLEDLRLGGSNLDFEEARADALNPVRLERTFNLTELKARYQLFIGSFQLFRWLPAVSFSGVMFLFLFVAFAIKVPVFPFHTWLPWAHVEAPTAISVILAGILLKMGVYGFLRVSYSVFPTEAINYAVPFAVLGVINILYGACCAMAQDDMKKLVAYSSVSHMGFCMLGMAALTQWGVTGSILQMFNHGTSTSMMFLLVGVIYDRAHHRDINRFGGLAQQLPVYAGLMTLALFASMGLPGLSGFISEVLVFLGAFRSNMGEISTPNWSFQSLTILAMFGVVLTAAYLLWMMQRVFFGPLNEKYKGYADMNGRELFTLAPLAVMVIAFGVMPQPLLDLTSKTVPQLVDFVKSSRDLKDTEVRVIASDGTEGAPYAAGEAPSGVTEQAADVPAGNEPAPRDEARAKLSDEPAPLVAEGAQAPGRASRD